MRTSWKTMVVCMAMAGALATGTAGAEEGGVCLSPATDAAAPMLLGGGVAVEQEPLFLATPAWCCQNGQLPCVQSTVEACTAAGEQPYPYAGHCTRALCG